jgi:glycosyltransferase involved in cell wall biosynthesis
MTAPAVTAVIPTFGRPDLVCTAARSALEQELPGNGAVEVLAVLDGPDPAAAAALRSLGDPRLRIIQTPFRRGHAAARNAGVAGARAPWCAFLDDDDRWLPGKLLAQLDAADRAMRDGAEIPIVACRVRAEAGSAAFCWPAVPPAPGEDIGDYLYSRRGPGSLLTGRRLIQTSMIMAPTEFLRAVPFRAGMRRHADPDWLLRAARHPGAVFIMPERSDPLAVWTLHQGSRVSAAGDWRYSLAWARRHRHLLSGRAYAGFLAGPAAHRAGLTCRGAQRRRAFAALIREAFARGTPGPWVLALFAQHFLGAGAWRERFAAAARAPR